MACAMQHMNRVKITFVKYVTENFLFNLLEINSIFLLKYRANVFCMRELPRAYISYSESITLNPPDSICREKVGNSREAAFATFISSDETLSLPEF